MESPIPSVFVCFCCCCCFFFCFCFCFLFFCFFFGGGGGGGLAFFWFSTFPFVTYQFDEVRYSLNNQGLGHDPPTFRPNIQAWLFKEWVLLSSQTVNTNFLIVGIKLNLLNKEVYGYMVNPSDANQTLEDMKISFTHVKLEWFGKFSSNNNNDNRGLFATHLGVLFIHLFSYLILFLFVS